MPVYKLSYFNAKATGELSRLILSTAGQDFEDDRLTNDTWPELKQSKIDRSGFFLPLKYLIIYLPVLRYTEFYI